MSNEVAEATSGRRLSITERFGYGVGDLGVNFYFGATVTYLLYFYTDVFGLSAAVAGSVFTVARIVDAITDPMMGIIADRTRTRWGKLRPYLLFGPVPLGLITVATFTTPDFGDTGKIIWAYATYITFGILYTVVSIPYSALTASLTSNYQERTTLSTVRIGCAFVGSYIVAVYTLPLVGMFDSEAEGFLWVVAGYCVAATLCLWLTFAMTQEREFEITANDAPPTLRQSLQSLLDNPPLLVVIGVFSCGMMAFTIRFSAVAYYFKYNLDRPDLIASYFGQTMPVMLAALFVVPWLSDRFGKANVLRVAAVISVIGFIGLFLTPFDRIEMIFFFSYLIAIGNGPIAVIGWAMVADTIEYAERKTGVRADGAIYSVASFFQKLASTVGGAGVAFLLAGAGFVANVAQSDAAVTAILWLMTLIPCSFMVILFFVAGMHKLDAKAHAKVVAEIAQRRG